MRGILNLSYMHLPVHLRPCFLYLGMYHEDHEIEKDDLVRQWIAEGFVCSFHGVDLDNVAKRYFDELLNRSLIQPERTIYGDVRSCRVHDMILDLILSKSKEDNFTSVAYNCEDMVRRLTLKSNVCYATLRTLATSMSQVRAYALFTDSNYAPPLSRFKYLRVLLFEFPKQLDMTVDLTAVGHLFLLRYLKVLAESARIVLPAEIRGLVQLETLELVCKSAQSFPSDITHLANLFHLRLPDGTALPKGIENMKLVRTLHCSGMSDSSLEDIKGLSELINLKELTLCTRYSQCLAVECVDALVSSIGMLRDLRDLYLDCRHDFSDYASQLDSLPDPPLCLEGLKLRTWVFSRVPKWIVQLRCLRVLDLRVLHLSSEDVRVLGELPSLFSTFFNVSDISQDKVVVGTGSFPVLESVWFRSNEAQIHCVSELRGRSYAHATKAHPDIGLQVERRYTCRHGAPGLPP
uniref:Uncharacterized protein n=1 Tax=Avena sativa TaxID=4498 RepID=A0ACD5V9E4_AVESA